MMKLNDTVEMMTSENYRQRFRAEYLQTKIRYEKLKRFCDRIEAAEITGDDEPKHDCPLYLLSQQLSAMDQYLHILELRALIEDVYIDDILDGGGNNG